MPRLTKDEAEEVDMDATATSFGVLGTGVGRRAATRILDLLDEVKELRERAQWRPIESVPRDRTRVLLYKPACDEGPAGISLGWWSEEDGVYRTGRGSYIPWPTHWQPLPAPPEATDASAALTRGGGE